MADTVVGINDININAMRNDFMGIFCPESPLHPVVKALLKDRTTKKNIVWATDLYKLYGDGYFPEDSQMTDWAVKDLMSCGVMLPRVLRTNEEKLYRSKKMKVLYPDDKERLKHIFEKQVYGLAPTEIIYKIATNYIFGFADRDSLDVDKSHFRCLDALPYAQGNEDMTLDEKLNEVFRKANK